MIMLDSSNSTWTQQESSPFSQSTPAQNSTPAIKKSSPKQEEEISIEDIPF
jgi:hypothetical protein